MFYFYIIPGLRLFSFSLFFPPTMLVAADINVQKLSVGISYKETDKYLLVTHGQFHLTDLDKLLTHYLIPPSHGAYARRKMRICAVYATYK